LFVHTTGYVLSAFDVKILTWPMALSQYTVEPLDFNTYPDVPIP
jgi:hypothetical protein